MIVTIATRFSRTTSRIPFDKEQFALCSITARAVSQFTRQTSARQWRFSLHHLSRLTSRITRRSRKYHFVYYRLSFCWVFFKIITQRLTHCLVHHTHHLAISEFSLSLPLKLWLCHFHRNHSSQTFTEVITRNLNLHFIKHFAIFRIFFQRTSQRTAEARHVSTALYRVNIIHIRVQVFRIRSVIHHRNLHWCTIFLCVDVDYVWNQSLTARVNMFHKFTQTIFRVEMFRFRLISFVFNAIVCDSQMNTSIQECQLAQTSCQNMILIHSFRENLRVWVERNSRTRSRSLTCLFHTVLRYTTFIILNIQFTTTAHFYMKVCRQCIHTTHTHTVQTT